MSTLDGERWRLISPHLDRALEIKTSERGPWLDALAARDPALAADLRRLLDETQPPAAPSRSTHGSRRRHRHGSPQSAVRDP